LGQVRLMDDLTLPVCIADSITRHNAAVKNANREEAKHMPLENTKWDCPRCGITNFVRVHIYSDQRVSVKSYFDNNFEEDYYSVPFYPVITPRIYFCHNSKCRMMRFYYREGDKLMAKYVGKYEEISEIAFASPEDPLKFYEGFASRRQINLF
jgi:hypothetical protein